MRLILASNFNQIILDILKRAKATNILFSYYYLQKIPIDKVIEEFKYFKSQGCFIMIDSGAHTFFSEEGLSIAHAKKKKTKQTDYMEYSLAYADWLSKMKDYIDVAVELDIDVLIGYEEVCKIRSILEASGAKIMPVWHVQLGEEEYERWLDKYDYIGIGLGDVANLKSILNVTFFKDKLVKAIKKNVKVHAFGLTRIDYMLKLPFYSVDSSSWSSGSRYGILVGLDKKKFKVIQKKVNNLKDFLKISRFIDMCGFTLHDIFKADKCYTNRDVINIQTYKKVGIECTKIWEMRGVKWKN